MSFEIGSIKIDNFAAIGLSQQFSPLGGDSIIRAMSGRAIKQSTWYKTKISTSGSGWIPASLASLDTDAQHVIKCVTAVSIPGDGSATLPAGKYRTDAGYEAWGTYVHNDMLVECDLTSGQVVLPVGATSPQIHYFPQLTVYAFRPSQDGDDSGEYSWNLDCEEV